MFVKAVFPIQGAEIPLDHGYALYSSLSEVVPAIHGNRDVAVSPIRGTHSGSGCLNVSPLSRLSIIAPLNLLPRLFMLSGKVLDLGCQAVLLGRMEVKEITSCESVGSRLVVFSLDAPPTDERFLEETRRCLSAAGINAEPILGKRRVVRVKGAAQVGYGLRFDHLSPSDSLKFQTTGLGGHRRFGCGVFTPVLNAKVKK